MDGAAAEDPALLRQEEREEAEAIFRQVERLAEPGRTVFALHALQGLSLAEISRRYRRSESWARVLYYRAKDVYKRQLLYKSNGFPDKWKGSLIPSPQTTPWSSAPGGIFAA